MKNKIVIGILFILCIGAILGCYIYFFSCGVKSINLKGDYSFETKTVTNSIKIELDSCDPVLKELNEKFIEQEKYKDNLYQELSNSKEEKYEETMKKIKTVEDRQAKVLQILKDYLDAKKGQSKSNIESLKNKLILEAKNLCNIQNPVIQNPVILKPQKK